MIPRAQYLADLKRALTRNPVTLLVGPRQSGKTTLAQQFLREDSINYFDLENPTDLARLDEPLTALQSLKGLVVIDEVQQRPELFPVLRVLADRGHKFLILGSASGQLMRQSSESLAGRMERITLSGFNLWELKQRDEIKLWLRGGLPLSYLAENHADSYSGRQNFIQTLLERDFPQWGVRIPTTTLRRFWNMLAHYHGQTWNGSEIAGALSVSQSSTRRYLDLLSDAFMVRQLQPYHVNIAKRQVKAPKIYVRDSGLLHQLLGIESEKALLSHPKVGTSWEGFIIESVLALVKPEEAFFWGTHQGAEIDLLLRKKGRMWGIECKRTDTPRITPSIRIALKELSLERIIVIYPGRTHFPITENVDAMPASFLGIAKNAVLFGA